MTRFAPTRPLCSEGSHTAKKGSPMNAILRHLRHILRSTTGAIDLASIMVAVIVIGIVSGVILATTVAVVPWAQDNAARVSI